MPVELHIIRASEFICLDADEHLDIDASKQALQSLALACRKRAIPSALIDLRTLPVLPRPHFTKTELATLVQAFHEAGFSREQRLAILYAHDVYGGIRDFAFISRLRGLQVQAFGDFEAAVGWLSEAEGNTAEAQPGEIKVPILKPRPDMKKMVVGEATPEPQADIAHPHHPGPAARRLARHR